MISRIRETIRLPKAARSFGSDESGVVAATFALLSFAIFVFVGAGIDTTRWLQARRVTINAMESATLAGLREYQENGNKSQAEALAQRNYNANIAARASVIDDGVSFVLIDNGGTIKMEARGSAKYETAFLRIIPSLDTIYVVKTDNSENPISELAVGENSGTSLEVAMMLDITGSMNESDGSGSTKLEAMKTAAKKLIDIVVWDDQSQYTSKVALVPFSEGVNLGDARAAAARLTNAPTQTSVRNMNSSGNTTWKRTSNCVVERTGPERFTDAALSVARVTPHYTTSGTCPTKSVLMPLTNDKSALKNSIDTYVGGGVTSGHIGTAWAWYTLSPNFNSLWGSTMSNARPYGEVNQTNAKGRQVLSKIAVLMTDGVFNTQFCNDGGTSTSSFVGIPDRDSNFGNGSKARCTAPNGTANAQTLSLCSAMKAKGITVYTIGFMVGSNEKDLLTQCATDPAKYFDAKDGAQLDQAFSAIAYALVPPYVSH